MKILITGGTGFIGSHLSESLLEQDHQVFVIDDLSTGTIENILHLKANPNFHYTIDTIMNVPVTAELVDRCDVVFHLAAAVGVKLIVESPVRTIETNIKGTEIILELANKKKKKVVITSTSEVYGKGKNIPFSETEDLVMGPTHMGRWSYACSKAIDEFLSLAYWHEKRLPVIVVRLFNTVGPKTHSLAALILSHLADGGPLRRAGFRCAVVSITKIKAGEMKQAAQDIAEASGLRGLTFKKSPAPGRIESRWGTCEVLSAADYEGHSSGFDICFLDDLGLLSERFRGLIAGLRSSLVAKRGRMIALSIVGDSPFTKEALALKDHPGVVVHHYAGLEGCEIDSPEQLEAANPGISAGILRLEDLVRDAKLAKKNPADQPHFRAHHLNQRQSPTKELICTVDDFRRCTVSRLDLPPREGLAWIGFDPGGSSSLSAACVIFDNGRTEFYAALPATPSLEARGVSDGCGGLYVQARARGELKTFSGRVTPIADFLAGVLHDLAGVEVEAGASDQYRRAEVEQVIEAEETGVEFEWNFRRMGSGPQGSNDVRAFQKMVLRAEIKTAASLLFAHGLSSATIARDGNGNPSLLRSGRGRIDLISAAVLAAGLRAAAVGDSDFGVSQRSVT